MKAKKLIALGLLAFMLSGCGMPKVDYNGVDSPLFVKDESGAAASGNETVTKPAGTAQNRQEPLWMTARRQIRR